MNIIFNRMVSPNLRGTDYFVGDIHGYLDNLEEQLRQRGFSRECDRLFLVGDMIDRGPYSLDTIALLEESYVFGVLGNHEWMFLQAMAFIKSLRDNNEFSAWKKQKYRWTSFGYMGGRDAVWFQDLVDKEAWETLDHIVHVFQTKLSVVITCDNKQHSFHVAHTMIPSQTEVILQHQHNETINIFTRDFQKYIFSFQLGQTYDVMKEQHITLAKNNDFVTIVGHYSVEKPVYWNNHILCDTGAIARNVGLLSLEEAIQLKEKA